MARLIRETLEAWPGDSAIIHGRPRHPQSQGAVERANQDLKSHLKHKLDEYFESHATTDSPPWQEWLPDIMCKC